MPEHIPKVSVIMPFRNAANFLDDSIQSILNQTFSDFEFIIINDASSDKSDEIVNKYILLDSRIIYVKNLKREGISKNLNKAINNARAGLIARMDGDDISSPDRLEKEYNFLNKNSDIVVVGTYVKLIDEQGNIVDQRTKPIEPNEILRDLIIYCPFIHSSVMYRKDVIQKIGSYRNKYEYCEDVDLWNRLGFSGCKMANIPEFLFFYRHHEKATTNRSVTKSIIGFKLQRDAIKRFRIKLSLKQRLIMYAQLLVGILLTGEQRRTVEGFYKRIVYGRK